MAGISNEALRKLIAAALASSNLATCVDESAIDRIGALAFADPLGAALWRLRLGHNAQAMAQAHALLAHRAKPLAPVDSIRLQLCATVLREWLDRNCRACAGRGNRVDDGGVKRQCTTCEGTGLRRYSDVWRMGQMKFDAKTYAKWARRFAAVHDIVAQADQRVYRQIAQQLERYEPSIGKIIAINDEPADNPGTAALAAA